MSASEVRAGWADAVRVFPGRPPMTLRAAVRAGGAPYVVGFLAGRMSGRRIPADRYGR